MADPETPVTPLRDQQSGSKDVTLKHETEKTLGGNDPPLALYEESSKIRRLRYAKQTLIILGASMGFQNEGLSLSWPNTFASDIQSDKSTLFNTTIHVADWQMDMMSSSLYIGSLLTIIPSAWLVSIVGRKRSMLISTVPTAIYWAIVALAPNTYCVLAGRILAGVVYVLLATALRAYVVEIPDVNIRGALGVLPEFMKSIGGIIIVALGMAMPWYYLALFGCFHVLIYGLVIIPFLPESPTYLVVKDKMDDATKVLKSLRGLHVDVSKSIKDLKEQNESDDGGAGWGVFLKPSVRKKCFIIFGLFLIANFSGSEVIRGNATRMLQSSGLTLDNDFSTLIVFVILLSGNTAQIFLLDKIGRRRCLVISLTLQVVSYTILGTCIHLTAPQVEFVKTEENATLVADSFISPELQNYWEWIPIICLMIAAFAISFGTSSLPYLLATEYFPTNIRPKILAFCATSNCLISLFVLQLFSPLQQALTPAGLFWFYACFSGLGIVYTLFFVQETKGISVG